MNQRIVPGNAEHDITPRLGTIRRAITGEPTNGLHPMEYPLVAVCQECGHVIRIERYFMADWVHVS
jgi:hypothetical protein